MLKRTAAVMISLALAALFAPVAASAQSSADEAAIYENGEIRLLARLIRAEAGDEDYFVQVAFGALIMNRVKSPLFPNSVSGVVYQRGAFACAGYGLSSPDEQSLRAARDAALGIDPTGGALFCYDPSTETGAFLLSRSEIITLGRFRFCA